MSRKAVITGGSRGIGAALVRKLAEMDYDVVINYHNESSAEPTSKLIEEIREKYGVNGYSIRADVSKFDECERILDFALDTLGDRIDALVNNAGVIHGCSFIEAEPELYEEEINTNHMSMLHMCRLFLPYMVDHDEYACIVNTASIGGLTGFGGTSAYSASKAGVIGFTRSLAIECAPRMVRVNALAPGVIMTDLFRTCGDQSEIDAIAAKVPEGRIGEPEDIALCMEYMLKADYLTGQFISPNGGYVTP